MSTQVMATIQGLPLTGVSSSINVKKRGEIFLTTCSSHVKYMHKILSLIYDGLKDDDEYLDDENDVEIEDEGDSSKLTQLFSDRCYQLITLMSQPTKGPVELPYCIILSVIVRCLKISFEDVLSVPSRTDLLQLLPCLHQCCLDVLSQLILCCRSNILPQSHLVIDLCMQTMTSTQKMCGQQKYRTRSSVYQTVAVWVRTCGWGKYLSSQCKALTQELIGDTQPDEDEKLAKSTPGDEVTPDPVTSSRKRKRDRKKKGHKGDSYMDLESENAGDKIEWHSEERQELIMWACRVSQLMVENVPFSISQNLVSHIIKTLTSVQKLSHNLKEPYCRGEARKGLYQALTSCISCRLDYGCNRNDAVSHYQMTNCALDILVTGCHKEEVEIESVCSQALDILRSSGNLKGPVIRKALEFEDTGVEDVGQILQEKEQMEDTIESLRQKLMTSEIENEQQSRLIADLREQMNSLQAKVDFSEAKRDHSSPRNKRESESEDTDEDEEMEEDEETQRSTESKTKPVLNMSSIGDGHQEVTKQGPPLASKDGETPSSSKDIVKAKVSLQEKQDFNSSETISLHKGTSKGKSKQASEKSPTKKAEMDSNPNSSDKAISEVDDMLLDFVDAPPDC